MFYIGYGYCKNITNLSQIKFGKVCYLIYTYRG
jgi:hypothetical protein